VYADLNVISHLVLDDKEFLDVKPVRREKSVLGGPPAYATMVTPLLSLKTKIITSVGKDFPEAYLHYLSSINRLELEILIGEESTKFLHKIYKNRRTMFLLAQADSLDEFVEEQKGGKACLISPVFREISNPTVKWAKNNHEYIGLDVQGFVRNTDIDRKIVLGFDNKYVKSILEDVDIVKFSLKEAEAFTLKKSYSDIFKSLPINVTNVITSGTQGVVFNEGENIYSLKSPIRNELDPTGAGDVMMTGILAEIIKNKDVDFCIAFGMALAAEKVQYGKIRTLASKNYSQIAEEILSTKELIK